VRLTTRVFRAHHPRWAFLPLSGEGAARYGGRFNAVGVPALYTSRRMETAWLEAQQGFPFKPQPLTICAYDVDCDPVLDLTDPGLQQRAGVSSDDLSCAWEAILLRGHRPPSWQLAQRLMEGGIAAIQVPSFAPGASIEDRNVVFWRWSDDLPCRVTLIDDEQRLQHNSASWE